MQITNGRSTTDPATQVMTVPFKLTGDGYETQFQVNYLAPHILVSSLMPILLSTAAISHSKTRVRVVNVASDAALAGPKSMQLDDVNMTEQKGMRELWCVSLNLSGRLVILIGIVSQAAIWSFQTRHDP
jgi:NAD(P)-dependent dehydrogenase (short-subunit alcohol dehydrogenase family)